MKITALEITTKIGCTNNCSYCPQELLKSRYKDDIKVMSFNTFAECMDKLDDTAEIHFTGMCEPFLNKDCIDMIKYGALWHKIRVSTTLIGLNLKDIEMLEGIDFIAFDVHLPAKTGDSIPVNDKYIKLLKAINDSSIDIAYHYHDEDLHPDIDFIQADMIKAHSRAGNIKWKETTVKTGVVKCIRKRRHPVLLPNGDLVICCMDYGLKHIIGSLLTHSIEQIYRGKGYKDFIKALKKGGSICHFCDDFSYQKFKEIL